MRRKLGCLRHIILNIGHLQYAQFGFFLEISMEMSMHIRILDFFFRKFPKYANKFSGYLGNFLDISKTI